MKWKLIVFMLVLGLIPIPFSSKVAAIDLPNSTQLKPESTLLAQANTGNFLVYLDQGNQHFQDGELNSAIADYDQTLQMNPSYAIAYYQRGLVHHESGDLPKAIQDYTQVLQIEPQNVEAYINRGIARHQTGDKLGGNRDLQKAASLLQQQGRINDAKDILDIIRNLRFAHF